MGLFIWLRLGDLHFCTRHPSHLYKIEFATESDGWCCSSGCVRLVFFKVHLQDVTSKDGPHAPSSHGRCTLATAWRLALL
jgi:hypothetical protein